MTSRSPSHRPGGQGAGSSSLGSFASTTSRILRARPWVLPALGLLVAAAAVALFWVAPRTDDAPPILNLKVVPGLKAVKVTFTTARPARASLDIAPATEKTKLPRAGEPATTHALEATGLAPATSYKLTVLLDGGGRTTVPFSTATLLLEGIQKQARLNRLKLSWTSTLPVRSSIVYEAPTGGAMHLDVPEQPGLAHEAELTGLSPDKNYRVTIISHTETGEVQHSAPFEVKLFTAASGEALAEVERANIGQRIGHVLWELRHKRPDRKRIAQLLGENLDPLRPPLKLVADIAREFFASPDVFVDRKLKLYGAVKTIEHLERLALVRGLPMVPLTDRIDLGPWSQGRDSFGDAALQKPLPRVVPPGFPAPPYFSNPALLPGITVDQQMPENLFLIENRQGEIEKGAIELLGRRADGATEATLRFAVRDPATVGRAELWVASRGTSPLQYLEVEVNGTARLVVRPAREPDRMKWSLDQHGLDPALLVPGENVVKLRLQPIPEVSEGNRTQVLFVELRTRKKS